MIYRVSKRVEIDAAHHLIESPNPESPCLRQHGHRYAFEVTFAASSLYMGMVVDFQDVSNLIKGVLEKYDHYDFNDKLPLNINPTAENILLTVYGNLSLAVHKVLKKYPNAPFIEKIRVYETPNGYAEIEL